MQTIPITSIEISENRNRREFLEEDLTRLKDSILDKGLLHPIVLRGKFLVAGERRLFAIRAIKDAGLSFRCNKEILTGDLIPYTEVGSLSDFKLLEAELEENVVRRDLTVQKYAVAVKHLDSIRRYQDPLYTAKDLTEEILGHRPKSGSYSTRLIRDNILIADNLEAPGVKEAKSQKEALKAVKRHTRKEYRTRLAAEYSYSIENPQAK